MAEYCATASRTCSEAQDASIFSDTAFQAALRARPLQFFFIFDFVFPDTVSDRPKESATTASPCAPRAPCPPPLGLGLYGDGAHGGMRRGERRTEVDAWRELGAEGSGLGLRLRAGLGVRILLLLRIGFGLGWLQIGSGLGLLRIGFRVGIRVRVRVWVQVCS